MKKTLQLLLAVLFMASIAYAQERTISGKVTGSEDGQPLPGVNVVVKGTTIGTATDLDGQYRLTVSGDDLILVFTSVGYQQQEVVVGNQTSINVQMSLDIEQLSEVVVVGYGTTIKQDLIGNVASVRGNEIENLPVTSVEQAIQGRTAGVLVSSLNGKLGQGMNIRVRGASSISANTEPLYVIDGIPVTSQSQSGTAAATNPLADINFNDIESLEILKDASAAAIYGSRGANGVILITTKKGKKGKTKFDINLQRGISKPTKNREWLNADQYVEMYMEAALNNDIADGFFADIDITNYDQNSIENHIDYPDSWAEYMIDFMDWMDGDYVGNGSVSDIVRNNTDWQAEAYQPSSITTFDINASGGSDKTSFYLSGSYSDQAGILIGNYFERASTRLNLIHNINEKVDFGTNISISRTVNDRVSNDNFFSTPLQLVAQSPITPVRNENGLVDDRLNPGAIYFPATVQLENGFYKATVFRNLISTYVDWEIHNTLNFRAEYGFDLLVQDEQSYNNSLTESADVGGSGTSRWTKVFNYTTKAYLNWQPSLGPDHEVNMILGTEFQESAIDITSVTGNGFPSNELKTIASAAEIVEGTATINEFAFLSYFTRLNYKFKNKYLLGFSTRIDGSSRFGANNKYGFFPSGSAGWILSEESFLNSSETISFLKLRASYGLTGNAGIPNYESYGTYSSASYNSISGLIPEQIPNPDLTWETTAQVNVGLDFGILNDRLSGGIDWYKKNTTDLLLNVPIPGTSGLRTQLQNIGELYNQGFEFVLNHTLVSNDFKWITGVNLATNKNEVTKLAPGQNIIDNGVNVVKIGEAIGTFFLPEFAGANPANGDALWYLNRDLGPAETVDGVDFVDYNGKVATSNYSDAEEVVVGNPNPTLIYGWSNTVNWNGIDFSLLFQGVSGNSAYLAGDTYMAANARYEDNQTTEQLNRWQKPGDITNIPQARLYSNNGAQQSSRYISDASYLRLKNLTVGYTFGENVIGKLGFSSLRVYFNSSNLLTFTKYTGWDPEVNTDYRASNINLANDFYSAPQPKTFALGVRAGF